MRTDDIGGADTMLVGRCLKSNHYVRFRWDLHRGKIVSRLSCEAGYSAERSDDLEMRK
jgi:hypothetical protein